MQRDMQVGSFISTLSRDWKDPPILHSHHSHEITVILEGRGECEGLEKTQVMEAGDVAVIPAGTPHRFGALSDIRFGVIHIERPDERTHALIREIARDEKDPRVVSLSAIHRDQFENLFYQWMRVMSFPLKHRRWNYEVWMQVILLFLIEHGHAGKKILSIAGTADYIQRHLNYPLQVSELAASVGLSKEAYRTLFKQMYGMTPKQYQQQCRLVEAKMLLSMSDKGMQEIAEKIGFSRLHSFSLWFKSMEGVSPSDWRKRQKKHSNLQ